MLSLTRLIVQVGRNPSCKFIDFFKNSIIRGQNSANLVFGYLYLQPVPPCFAVNMNTIDDYVT